MCGVQDTVQMNDEEKCVYRMLRDACSGIVAVVVSV